MTLKITLGQFEPILGDKQKNLATMKEILKQAVRQKSDLVLFPELCLTGYFIQNLQEDVAESIEGPSIRYVRELCEKLSIYTVFSWPERGEDGNIYNSACLISNQGEVVGNYRKIHLYDREKEIFTPGNDFYVFETELGRIGIIVCFDLDFPESARMLHAQEADIILIPTNNFHPYERYQEVYVKVRAMENETPVAICNRVGQEEDLKYFGESAAFDAHGYQLLKLDKTGRAGTVQIPLHKEKDEKLNYRENRIPAAYHKLTEINGGN